MCQRYEPNQVDTLCTAHKQANKCLEACPEGEMRNVGMNALTPLNFMCVDRFEDFKKHLPCLDSNCEFIEKSCQPSCRQYLTSVNQLTELQRDMNARQSYGAPAITKIISDACGFIECFNKCSRPVIVDKCGPDAADLQRDTVKKAFASISNLLSNIDDDEDALPNSCASLILPPPQGQQEDLRFTENATLPTFTKSSKKSQATKEQGQQMDGEATEMNIFLENEAIYGSAGQIQGSFLTLLGLASLLLFGQHAQFL